MKILILNWKDIYHPQVGGAEVIVYELARRLVRDGHDVTWFCRYFTGGKSEEVIDGIKIVRRGQLITTYLYAPLYYWSIPTKPDLVIDMSNTICWQAPIWAWFSKKIAYLNQFGSEVFFYEYPWPLAIFGFIVEKIQYLTYRSTHFLCYSQSTKKDLISIGIPKDNIGVFSLGLDLKRYVPGKKSKTPLFICVSRLVKMKQTNLAIQAMPYVLKNVPSAKLVIIGTGYDRTRLEKIILNLNLSKSVSFSDQNTWFFSKNTKDQKLKLMQQAWALIFPSVKEGWGMTVTECAACATPTIGTRVSGLQDSIRNGITGILISSHPHPKEIAVAMIKIIKNPKLRKNLSTQAYEYSKEFTWENSYKEFLSLILK